MVSRHLLSRADDGVAVEEGRLQELLATTDLAALIDHGVLDPLQSTEMLTEQVDAARHFGFAGLCVPSRQIPQARERLGTGTAVRLIAVVGFPTGAVPTAVKLAEARWVAEAGADEIDVVPDFTALLDGDADHVHGELAAVADVDLPFKVILESARLPEAQLQLLVDVAVDAGAQWLKTNTGYGPGATPDRVRQLATLTRGRAGITAAGGIRSLQQALLLVEAGADRLGLSRGPALIQAARDGDFNRILC